ncbi:uncharacterized protein LOC100381865 [Zea mays]|uniref:Uncharacterized protein n=1 Tax=Zea mays TaxID=4577 RepID=C0P2E5_MAIZE|nr:uncharacterized protein LOC100381865 [Zea mays]ACN27161.1 unknown [Zea mays]|eukprot:NP_001168122.1 uncharacterized protein LOC100381865 [Zea mays]
MAWTAAEPPPPVFPLFRAPSPGVPTRSISAWPWSSPLARIPAPRSLFAPARLAAAQPPRLLLPQLVSPARARPSHGCLFELLPASRASSAPNSPAHWSPLPLFACAQSCPCFSSGASPRARSVPPARELSAPSGLLFAISAVVSLQVQRRLSSCSAPSSPSFGGRRLHLDLSTATEFAPSRLPVTLSHLRSCPCP